MITDLELYPLQLVKGGHPTISSGNRCKQLADELEDFPLLGESSFQAATVVQRLIDLAHLEVNIVGSRGYVYHTPHILKMVARLKPGMPFQWNLFPRAGGLREALMLHFEAEMNDGWL
jgi:hypothetical protein